MFYKFSDRAIHLDHIKKVSDPIQSRNAFSELKEVVKLCSRNTCICSSILQYFGEDSEDTSCNKCSCCLNVYECVDLPVGGEIRNVKGNFHFMYV